MKIVFFGQLKEVLGVTGLEHSEPCENVAELRQLLQSKGDNWQEYLSASRSLVAVNHELSDDSCVLSLADEVAFFPPVTGG